MKDRLFESLNSHNVDYVDIRIEDNVKSWVNYRGDELDTMKSYCLKQLL